MSKIISMSIISSLLTGVFSMSMQANEEVDILLTDGYVLTIDKDKSEYKNGYVAIKDSKIVAVGDMQDIEPYTAKKTINVDGDIIMPGMINTHTHASMSVFRSLADDVPDRLHKYIFPLEAEFVSKEMVKVGAELANVEMLQGGVTTYADMYYFEDIVAETVDEIGMRAVLGETVIKFPVADAQNAQEGIAYALKFINMYKDHQRITPAFAPHAPYTNTTETLQEIAKLARELDVPVMIHLAESTREAEEIAKRADGLSPIAYMSDIGALDKHWVAAHVIEASDEDIEILKANDVGVAHNMSANIKSAKGVAPALKMFDDGLRIGLGTDGPMSGNTLSIIDEFGQVAKVHKLVNNDRSAMPPYKVIEMATIGGARALHMEDDIGSIENGKLADIIVVGTKSANMTPIYNPYSALVYSAYASDVRHSIVHGKLLMEDRNVMSVDSEQIRLNAVAYAEKIKKYLIEKGEEIK